METRDPRVDAYIEQSADFAKPILKHLRSLVHKACPDVEETMKWNFPHFEYKGLLCSMAAFKEHAAFGFWKEKLLLGTNPGSRGAMGSFGRITSLKDLPDDRTLIAYIKRAMELNEQGIKTLRRTPQSKKTLKIPLFFRQALQKNKKAAKTFESFSYSNKKDYVEWVTEAKTEETRKKRLATALEWIAQGKVKNWKYLRK